MRRLLIVDDHAPFRLVARVMLERSGFQVVGEAANGSEAVAEVHLKRPDVVLLDVNLPGDDGFSVCQQLIDAQLGLAVVLTSSRDEASFRRRLGTSKARGFISKSNLTADALVEVLTAAPT
jgi:DNA-binding NarL/FixJ family response regulator